MRQTRSQSWPPVLSSRSDTKASSSALQGEKLNTPLELLYVSYFGLADVKKSQFALLQQQPRLFLLHPLDGMLVPCRLSQHLFICLFVCFFPLVTFHIPWQRLTLLTSYALAASDYRGARSACLGRLDEKKKIS